MHRQERRASRDPAWYPEHWTMDEKRARSDCPRCGTGHPQRDDLCGGCEDELEACPYCLGDHADDEPCPENREVTA